VAACASPRGALTIGGSAILAEVGGLGRNVLVRSWRRGRAYWLEISWRLVCFDSVGHLGCGDALVKGRDKKKP